MCLENVKFLYKKCSGCNKKCIVCTKMQKQKIYVSKNFNQVFINIQDIQKMKYVYVLSKNKKIFVKKMIISYFDNVKHVCGNCS